MLHLNAVCSVEWIGRDSCGKFQLAHCSRFGTSSVQRLLSFVRDRVSVTVASMRWRSDPTTTSMWVESSPESALLRSVVLRVGTEQTGSRSALVLVEWSRTLLFRDDNLIATGNFLSTGDSATTLNRLSRWDGTNWAVLAADWTVPASPWPLAAGIFMWAAFSLHREIVLPNGADQNFRQL